MTFMPGFVRSRGSTASHDLASHDVARAPDAADGHRQAQLTDATT
jgi:hypothetical protein